MSTQEFVEEFTFIFARNVKPPKFKEELIAFAAMAIGLFIAVASLGFKPDINPARTLYNLQRVLENDAAKTGNVGIEQIKAQINATINAQDSSSIWMPIVVVLALLSLGAATFGTIWASSKRRTAIENGMKMAWKIVDEVTKGHCKTEKEISEFLKRNCDSGSVDLQVFRQLISKYSVERAIKAINESAPELPPACSTAKKA